MGNTLKNLFDYQRFEGNRELQNVIDSVHARYKTRELELEDMETVFAAGTPELTNRLKKQENSENAGPGTDLR